MEMIQLLLLAMALAADAFSVSAIVGLQCRGFRRAFRITFHFGLFQALFAFLGAIAGTLILSRIESWDHWIVFFLLLAIGGRMAYNGIRGENQSKNIPNDLSRGMTMIGLSIAVSVDALAAGIGLPAFGINIGIAAVVIGIVTTAISIFAWNIAAWVSNRWRATAEIIGGLMLVAIGVRTLLQHLLAA